MSQASEERARDQLKESADMRGLKVALTKERRSIKSRRRPLDLLRERERRTDKRR